MKWRLRVAPYQPNARVPRIPCGSAAVGPPERGLLLPARRYDRHMTLDLADVLRPEIFVPITVAIIAFLFWRIRGKP
jgi:hypothetical protein